MNFSTSTVRRAAALTSAAAVLALPGAALAMPAPDTGYHASSAVVTPTVTSPSTSGGSDDNTLAIVLASGACAIALGGVAYSVKLGSNQRHVLRAR